MKANVAKLKPFTLYQFKVRAIRHGANQTSLYSESIECYTNEDGESSINHCLTKQNDVYRISIPNIVIL